MRSSPCVAASSVVDSRTSGSAVPSPPDPYDTEGWSTSATFVSCAHQRPASHTQNWSAVEVAAPCRPVTPQLRLTAGGPVEYFGTCSTYSLRCRGNDTVVEPKETFGDGCRLRRRAVVGTAEAPAGR